MLKTSKNQKLFQTATLVSLGWIRLMKWYEVTLPRQHLEDDHLLHFSICQLLGHWMDELCKGVQITITKRAVLSIETRIKFPKFCN